MKFLVCFILVLASFLPLSTAQAQSSTPPFVMNFDYARFRNDASTCYLELYYSFYCGQVTLQQDGERLRGGLVLETIISAEQADQAVVTERMTLPIVLEDTTGAAWKMRSIIRQAGHLLPNAKYSLRIVAYDSMNHASKDSLSLTLNAQAFSGRPAISDLELCSSIKSSGNKADAYFKNGYEVVPNPTLVFGSSNHPVVYVYVEFYYLETSKIYNVDYEILDDSGGVVKKTTRRRRYANSNTVEIGTMNAVSYQSGSYFLRVSLTDAEGGQSVQAQKKFYIYNPDLAPPVSPTASDAISMIIDTMSVAQVEQEFQQAKYLADKTEIYFFSQLNTIEAKKEFLKNFWRKIEAGSESQPPRRRAEYMQRIAVADQLFSAFRKGGWRTDRGRVFALYGKPEEIERHPSDAAKPYEIWYYYHLENGAQFVFVEKSGFGDYELVHSTKRGELEDDGWMRFIQ